MVIFEMAKNIRFLKFLKRAIGSFIAIYFFALTKHFQWNNFSVTVYIAVRIHVVFDYMNHKGFFPEKNPIL